MTSPERSQNRTEALNEAILAFALAVAAAVAIKVPVLFGVHLDQNDVFYARNLSLFVLPFLTGYFVWKRQLDTNTVRWLATAFSAAVLLVNIYPFAPEGDTWALTVIHLPIALWLIVGIAYAGRQWNNMSGRMDFIRFTGEAFIFYVLIALGGGVLTGLMALIFQTIAIDIEPFFESWLLPCGAVGAVIIASWLVESQKGISGNMAPMLARLFTPLFMFVLIAFLGTLLWTGRGMDIERNVLIAFDLLLVVVLGLLLYSIAVRDLDSPFGAFDLVLTGLLISALLADIIALWAIAGRITEFGFTPNRLVALGLNVILLVNLAWSAVLYTRFLRRLSSFSALVKWQTNYLPVYAVWAAIVVIIIPPLFSFA